MSNTNEYLKEISLHDQELPQSHHDGERERGGVKAHTVEDKHKR